MISFELKESVKGVISTATVSTEGNNKILFIVDKDRVLRDEIVSETITITIPFYLKKPLLLQIFVHHT